MIVITGPSGNVGVELTRLLLQHQPAAPLRIGAYDVGEIVQLCGPSDTYVPLDYDDRSTWPAVLDGVRTLFLLFPLPTTKSAGTRMKPFIEAAVAAGCRHIVFISVGGAASSQVVPHHPVEEQIKALRIDYTILRPCYYMQNLCRNITTHDYDIAMHDEVFVPAGAGVTTLVDARDVAEAVAGILLHPKPHAGRDYSLTGLEQLNFNQVADVLSAVTGRRITYTRPSLPRFCFRMLHRRIPWDIVAFMCLFYSIIRFGKPEPLTDDLATLISRPPRTLRTFAEDYRALWEPGSHQGRPRIPSWAGG